MSYIQWKPNQPANVSLPMTDQVMATWDPEPWAPHLKAWLEQTSALGEEGELPEGGPWPQVVDSLPFLIKSPQLLGLLGVGHWSFPIVPSTASPISGTPAASTSFVPGLSTSEIYVIPSRSPRASSTFLLWPALLSSSVSGKAVATVRQSRRQACLAGL